MKCPPLVTIKECKDILKNKLFYPINLPKAQCHRGLSILRFHLQDAAVDITRI